MTKSIFIFIASVLLAVPLTFSAGEIPIDIQLIVCAPLILLFGIPHGAIDNVLYLRKLNYSNSIFISAYVAIVLVNILLWKLSPAIAYIVFLILSAYHFGQSQFSHYLSKQAAIQKLLYFFWGLTLLAGLVFLKIDEVHGFTTNYSDFSTLEILHNKTNVKFVFFTSALVTLCLLIHFLHTNIIPLNTFFMEILVLCLVLFCFYITPLLIGFTLYFVILHSIKVLKEEYQFLKLEGETKTIGKFIRLVTPLSVLSYLGIGFLFALIYIKLLEISYGYCLLIIISSITLPHVFVMNRFYSLIFNKQLQRVD